MPEVIGEGHFRHHVASEHLRNDLKAEAPCLLVRLPLLLCGDNMDFPRRLRMRTCQGQACQIMQAV